MLTAKITSLFAGSPRHGHGSVLRRYWHDHRVPDDVGHRAGTGPSLPGGSNGSKSRLPATHSGGSANRRDGKCRDGVLIDRINAPTSKQIPPRERIFVPKFITAEALPHRRRPEARRPQPASMVCPASS